MVKKGDKLEVIDTKIASPLARDFFYGTKLELNPFKDKRRKGARMHGCRHLFLSVLTLTLFSGLVHAAVTAEPKKRHFLFTYKVKLASVPQGDMKFWIPVADSNREQVVTLVKINAPVPLEKKKEREYGNSLLFGRVKDSDKELEIELQYEVTRIEQKGSPTERSKSEHASPKELARFLKSDHLTPLNDRIRKLAAEVTRGKTTPIAKARAIYDYVTDNLSYDKSGTGWGRGDINYVCDVKRGNCTDFHALFIGLCRASGIPARFIIGFPIPEGKIEGNISGYHCWAEFYAEGRGWIPVDTSEANKNKSRKEYYFGNLSENRVEFTQGRDILLEPRQHGEKLNFFIYPYAELNGKPYEKMETSFTFLEL
jgi:transglutaminase-like putative cysteine protease